jgi:hypothetical protein
MTTEKRDGESDLAWPLYRQFGAEPKGKRLKEFDTTKKWPLNKESRGLIGVCGQAAASITSFGARQPLPELQLVLLELQRVP